MAAASITKETKAVAIVVSEETGQISLALDGQIERNLDADRLRARLESLLWYGRPRKPSRRHPATSVL